MAFLEIDDVHKSYGQTEVLKGVSLDVERHEVVCLIGASGSGKSTLLRCVNALEEISSGAIRIEGDTVSGTGVDLNVLRRDVGIVFQSYNLFPHMSVLQNLMEGPVTVQRRPAAEVRAECLALLDRVGQRLAVRQVDGFERGQFIGTRRHNLIAVRPTKRSH